MTEPLGRAETRALLERHAIRLRKDLGQHFLVEPNVVRRIVEIAGVAPGSRVLEIGAGAGTLTRALADAGADVVAYEIDVSLAPLLEETVGDRAEIRFEDAASVDFDDSLPVGEWTVVANLPYNVGTPLVLDLLRKVPRITRLVVMLQLEAVERLAAGPGSKVYGLPSVVVALHGTIRVAMRVPPHLFVPAPPVESAIAVIERIEPAPEAEKAIAIATVAFNQRRKMLRSSLRHLVSVEQLALAGIDPTARPEDLEAADFLAMARAA